MAIDVNSRYRFTRIFIDDVTDPSSEKTFLGFRDPIRFVDDRENVIHVVRAGDTLQTLAEKQFKGFEEPATLFWVIAEFQPTPIAEPTLRLTPGSLLVLPSPNLVHNLIRTPPILDVIV